MKYNSGKELDNNILKENDIVVFTFNHISYSFIIYSYDYYYYQEERIKMKTFYCGSDNSNYSGDGYEFFINLKIINRFNFSQKIYNHIISDNIGWQKMTGGGWYLTNSLENLTRLVKELYKICENIDKNVFLLEKS